MTNASQTQEEQTCRDAIRQFLLSAIQIANLRDDDNLFESGLVNSLFAVQLMTFLEKKFGIEIGPDDLDIENFKSVSAASAFVIRKKVEVDSQ